MTSHGASRDTAPIRDSYVGSRLIGPPDQPGQQLSARIQLLLTASIVAANIVGSIAAVLITAFVLGSLDRYVDAGLLARNIVLIPLLGGTALAIGVTWGTIHVRRQLRWVREDRPPTAQEQLDTLRVPVLLTKLQAVLWGLASIVFTAVNGVVDLDLASEVLPTVVISGANVCAISYLTTEFLLRPVAARALADSVPASLHVPGVTARSMLAWFLGIAPVVGLMLVAVSALVREDVDLHRLALNVLVLGGTTLTVGTALAGMAARATADPVLELRAAMERLDDGDLEVEVTVYDGTEVGRLQAGFNQAVAGLRERERVRDLFGRHVGEEVARAALEQDPELGGTEVDVAVLFVDVIGSTRLAATRPPHEVVELLNRFFTVVVDVVTECGGLVNKFEGDAALAIFGAPTPMHDAAGAALRAGRRLAQRLATEVDACRAGIGISAGPAVAGNIGNPRRFEYTVIGDAVNEAARLTDVAKDAPDLVAASMRAVEAAAAGEADHWVQVGESVLRGRSQPTRIAHPVSRRPGEAV